jgi:hypothetical protein
LYKEGNLSGETAKRVEAHLKECESCAALYREDGEAPIVFSEGMEPPEEKRYMLKLKKVFYAGIAALAAVLVGVSSVAYAAGDYAGMIGGRFRVAQENGLFTRVDVEAFLDGQSIVLEEALLDSTATTLVFKTGVDLNDVDSLTMRDDRGRYYAKALTFLNAQPIAYESSNGYTVVNFEPVIKDANALTVELVKRGPGGDETAVFSVPVIAGSIRDSSIDMSDVLRARIGSTGFLVKRIQSGASQAQIDCVFDLEDGNYDGVCLGWSQADAADARKYVSLESGGNILSVLSVQDATDEIRMENPGLAKTWLYRIACDPIAGEANKLKIEFDGLFGYYSLKNKEITVALQDGSDDNTDVTVRAGGLVLEVLTVQRKDGRIHVQYSVRNGAGDIVRDAMLDMRIRPAGDEYAVPEEGTIQSGGIVNSVSFPDRGDGAYVLSLARLGVAIGPAGFEINIK